MGSFLRGPSAPYVIPFAVFMALLAAQPYVPLPQAVDLPVRCAILAAVLWIFSRKRISFQTVNPLGSILIGIAVIAVWVAPDALFPGYRQHWLFTNSFTGQAVSTMTEAAKADIPSLFFRALRAIVFVPIIEELFWRGWLLRWVADTDFEKLPLGSYTAQSFWIVSILFASVHGPYWEVALICGITWNWWMGKTKSLGDLILSHAVANATLSAYVLATGKWEYWM
jgi:uncharacterized protein